MSKRLDNFVVDKATGKKQIFWVGHTAYRGPNAFKTCSDLGHIGTELMKRGVIPSERKGIIEIIQRNLRRKGWAYETVVCGHRSHGMKWSGTSIIEIKVDLDYDRHHNL